MACAAVSCSACASRSAASHSGSLSLVGDHQHLRRPGDGIDADRAEHLPLGGGHVGVARADDLGHRRDRLGAVGERGHGLRAADAIDLARRRPDARPPAPAGSSRRPATAPPWRCAARRRPGPARRSSARSSDSWRARPARRGRPTRSPSSASRARRRARRCSGRRVGQLAAVMALDARARQLERGQRRRVACRHRRGDLRRADAHAGLGEVEAVEAAASARSAPRRRARAPGR